MTTLERIASWATELAFDDVPDDVIELCRAQRRSVFGAIAASAHDAAARRVVSGVESSAPDGPAPLLGTDRTTSVETALYAAAALSIALDFDDYVCFGHTSHSAVLVPVMMAAETATSGERQLVAQVVANEVEARLGGMCILGPLNGQLWSFIHVAGAALSAGLVLGLDETQLAHALAISLYQAPRPTVPGFMAPDSKLLTASEPTATGVRAARLAAAGVTGPLDVLDHPQGFPRAFSYAPLKGMLSGLGEQWATRTLSVKVYPGCAYVDTVLDAVLSLGPPFPEEVRAVVVEAGMLTCGMDAMSSRYASHRPSPVTVTFSVPWNVAVALTAGRVTPHEISDSWLEERRRDLRRIAGVVRVVHDGSLSLASARAFTRLLPPSAIRKEIGVRKLRRALARMHAEHAGVRIGIRDLVGMLRRANVRSAASALRGKGFWSPDALDNFAMTFPARVRVVLAGGRELSAEVDVPRGGAGHPSFGPIEASRAKLGAWGPRMFGADGTSALTDAIDRDADDLHALAGKYRTS